MIEALIRGKLSCKQENMEDIRVRGPSFPSPRVLACFSLHPTGMRMRGSQGWLPDAAEVVERTANGQSNQGY